MDKFPLNPWKWADGLRQRYLNATLKAKFIISNLIVVLIPILIVGTLLYQYASKVTEENAAAYKYNIIELMSERMDSYLNQLKLMTYSMYQLDVQDMLTKELLTSSVDKLRFDEKLFSYLIANANFTRAEGSFDNAVFIRPDGRFHQTGSMAIKADFAFVNTDWYQTAVQSKGQIEMIFPNRRPYLEIPPAEPAITIVRQIHSLDGIRQLGVLIIDVEINQIARLFRSMPLKPDDDIYIINEKGRIIYNSSKPQLIGSDLPPEYYGWMANKTSGKEIVNLNNERVLVTYHTSPSSDWKFISIDRMGDLTQTLSNIKIRTFLLGILSLLVGILLANFFSSQVTKPIHILQRRMKRFQTGDFESQVRWSRKDEIGNLAGSFNEMTEQISQLIQQNYVARIKEREAQFHALQAQINPHFLYNTLDSISSIALVQNAPLINEMSNHLASMLRYSISKAGPVVTLQEELDHITAYLLIQNIRYGNKYTTVWDIQSCTLKLPLIKLTLQPLVENAIYHGLEMKVGAGEICISSWVDQDIFYIEIKDDGLGIPPDRLDQIVRDLGNPPVRSIDSLSNTNRKSIGIDNVHDRIRLQFGNQYGLSITSHSSGTTVVVRLPVNIKKNPPK
jgi:two-component system sensor histidine kinase YesM